jgi:hypothetical protein
MGQTRPSTQPPLKYKKMRKCHPTFLQKGHDWTRFRMDPRLIETLDPDRHLHCDFGLDQDKHEISVDLWRAVDQYSSSYVFLTALMFYSTELIILRFPIKVGFKVIILCLEKAIKPIF